MARRLLKQYGWWALSVLLAVGVLSGLLLLPDARAGKIVDSIAAPVFDTELYKSILSRLVVDETELVDQFNADYLLCYPLMPPAPDWQLVMEGGVIPYDKSSFPASWFLDELTPTSDMGVSCFSVILWLDPVTWQTVVFDEITMKEVTALSVPAGFNMLDLITAAWGERILYGVDKEWVLSAYSPSRMAFRYRLVEKDDVDDLVAEYSAAVAVTPLASAPLKSAPTMMKSSSSSMEISAIEKTASGMEITIELPNGWTSTNSIDVFKTANLVSYWWSLLGTTSGSNTVTYTDTGSGSSDVELRFYRAGDGDTDSDSDGYADARELLMYHSDPEDEDSYPVTVSGSVTHSNTPQTGLIHVVAVTASNSWDLGRFDDLTSPGSFEITGIPNLDNYWIKAWRDWCDNDEVDLWEASGTATNCPLYLTDSVSNIVITLTDPPASISGTLSYTGKQEGAWFAIVSTVETSWTASASCTAALSGFYHLSDLSQTSYYVKAWIDADGDYACNTNSEANNVWTSNPINLSNSVWNIDFELTDVNGDGDTMPDWWELLHFGNTNQTDAGDYDGDTMPNAWEYEWDFCPTNAADAMQDYDGDGYFNVYEYHHGTDPHNIGSVPTPGGSGGSSPTPSATVTVVTNGTPIQAALDQATNSYDIVLVEAGTYSGVSNCNLTFPSQPILLIGEDGADATVIDCSNMVRGARFISGQTNHSCIASVTIKNGFAVDGGGILISNANPTVYSCIITNCSASNDGAGMYLFGSDATVWSCTLVDNDASDDGGGAYLDDHSDAAFVSCVISNNTAGKDGGGIAWDDGSDGSMANCEITGNTAEDDGGGIYCEQNADPALTGCTISGNLAKDNGGGMMATDSADPELVLCIIEGNTAYDHGGGFYGQDTEAELAGCIINENTAVDGGGIGCNASAMSIVGCTVVDNWAHVDGGGIRAKDCAPVVRNCLIARNRAFGNGGGVQVKGWTGSVALENCTVADNESRLSGGGASATEYGSVSATNSIVWGNAPDQLSGALGLAYSCVQGGASGTGIITNDPAMTPYWFRLKSGSSCTNAGTNAAWMTSAYDIDGEARITNGVVDIGADELYDSDADGMGDTWEIEHFDDLDEDGTDDADGDGLDDADEYVYDADPADADTDGDGLLDGVDAGVAGGPTTAYPGDVLTLDYRFGDTNGSSVSEKYILTIVNSTNASDKVCETNPVFAAQETGDYGFTMGAEYEISLAHHLSNTAWPTIPDYDYHVYIEDSGGPTGWIFGVGYAISDTNGILGNHWEDDQTTILDATNRTAQLYILLCDLDPDTDGDGVFGEPTDEAQESCSPGKRLRVNDDDNNTNCVADCGDWAADASENDLYEIKVAMGPTNLNVGTVVLEVVEGASNINVWSAPCKGASNLLVGASGSTSTNWTLGAGGDLPDLGAFPYGSLWVEGVTNCTALGDVRIALRYLDTSMIVRASDTNVFTAFSLQNADWQTYPGNLALDTCPTGGGKRIFPGKLSSTDTSIYRKRVHMNGALSPDISAQKVYFAVFDVDDPTTNSAPIDDNGSTGGDNRGSSTTGSVSYALSDSGGDALEDYDVSYNPGDNFRFYASLHPEALSNLTQTAVDTNDIPLGIHTSSVLTVWRKLHVEVDSMGAPPTGTTFVASPPDYYDAPVTNIPDPDCGGMTNAFWPAFIDPVLDTGNNTPDVLWIYNMSSTQVTTIGTAYCGTPNSVFFWRAYICGAYEYTTSSDGDPYWEGHTMGITPWPSTPNYSYVFTETIRDVFPSNATNRAQQERKVVIHEIGHQFQLGHATGTVVSVMKQGSILDADVSLEFSADEIHLLRDSGGL